MERNNSLSLTCLVRKGRKNRKEQYPVYLRISVGGKRVELITNVVISLDKWNAAKGRVKGTIEETRRWNHLLDNLEQKVREIYNRHLLEGKILSSQNIKNEINGLENMKRLLIATFENEVSQMQLMEGNGYATGTIKNWQVTLRHLKEFLKDHYHIDDISFRQLDHQFVVDLDWYARMKWKCKTNAVLKHFQRLQKVVRIAHNRGWIHKNPFANYNQKQETTHRTFLTPDELGKLENKYFSLSRLEHVKDIFIFSCYTGLAFVDIAGLSTANIQIGVDGKQWIFTYRQKTRNKSNVPLLPPAISIIEKYQHDIESLQRGQLFPVINNSKTNAYLKEIADLCGIQKNLTFHMARHTFATTVTLSNGVPMETVSNMLGHTKITTTQIYAKVLENKVSDDMMALESKLFRIKGSE